LNKNVLFSLVQKRAAGMDYGARLFSGISLSPPGRRCGARKLNIKSAPTGRSALVLRRGARLCCDDSVPTKASAVNRLRHTMGRSWTTSNPGWRFEGLPWEQC
jgi:hypothetical protein